MAVMKTVKFIGIGLAVGFAAYFAWNQINCKAFTAECASRKRKDEEEADAILQEDVSRAQDIELVGICDESKPETIANVASVCAADAINCGSDADKRRPSEASEDDGQVRNDNRCEPKGSSMHGQIRSIDLCAATLQTRREGSEIVEADTQLLRPTTQGSVNVDIPTISLPGKSVADEILSEIICNIRTEEFERTRNEEQPEIANQAVSGLPPMAAFAMGSRQPRRNAGMLRRSAGQPQFKSSSQDCSLEFHQPMSQEELSTHAQQFFSREVDMNHSTYAFYSAVNQYKASEILQEIEEEGAHIFSVEYKHSDREMQGRRQRVDDSRRASHARDEHGTFGNARKAQGKGRRGRGARRKNRNNRFSSSRPNPFQGSSWKPNRSRHVRGSDPHVFGTGEPVDR